MSNTITVRLVGARRYACRNPKLNAAAPLMFYAKGPSGRPNDYEVPARLGKYLLDQEIRGQKLFKEVTAEDMAPPVEAPKVAFPFEEGAATADDTIKVAPVVPVQKAQEGGTGAADSGDDKSGGKAGGVKLSVGGAKKDAAEDSVGV